MRVLLPDRVQVYFPKPAKQTTVKGNNAASFYCTEMGAPRIWRVYRDFGRKAGLPVRYWVRGISCTGVGFGCTIVYTGAWLGWKYFLVKVFTRPCGVIKTEAEVAAKPLRQDYIRPDHFYKRTETPRAQLHPDREPVTRRKKERLIGGFISGGAH
jgi:hypothetical protein